MSLEGVARRYARAIFEIGKASGSLGTLGKDVAAFAAAASESRELRAAFSNPLLPDASREAIVKEVAERLQLSPTAVSALRLVARRNRLAGLTDISRQLAVLVDEDASIVRAEVTSAGPLSEEYLKRLQTELEKATGHNVVITHKQDPTLIAGVVTRIGDRVIDGSARTRLSSFRESLERS